MLCLHNSTAFCGERRTTMSRVCFSAVCLFAVLLTALAVAPSAFADDATPQAARAPLQPGTVAVGKNQWVVARPLSAFTLYTVDDQAVPAQTLVQSGYWLIVYRDRRCPQCDTLMQMLSQHSEDASHIVFVISDITGSDLLQFEQKYPDLAAATWLRDVKHNFSSAMKITGTPHVLAMRNGGIRWQRAGVSADDTAFPIAVDTWLKYNLLPPNKFVRTPPKRPGNQKAAPDSAPQPAAASPPAAQTGAPK